MSFKAKKADVTFTFLTSQSRCLHPIGSFHIQQEINDFELCRTCFPVGAICSFHGSSGGFVRMKNKEVPLFFFLFFFFLSHKLVLNVLHKVTVHHWWATPLPSSASLPHWPTHSPFRQQTDGIACGCLRPAGAWVAGKKERRKSAVCSPCLR